jgi:hypothetical protein
MDSINACVRRLPFTVITATGDRPQALDLCASYIKRSTIQPFQWLVVDDGNVPYNPGGCDYKRREPTPLTHSREGCNDNSIAQNLGHVMQNITFDKIVVMEDDDWYDPKYLETMYNLLDNADLVGEGLTWVYNVKSRLYKRHHNNQHASFCASGMTRKVVPLMQDICTRDMTFLDMALWSESKHTKHLILEEDTHLCVGMKGLPGRAGVTNGHKLNDKLYRGCSADEDCSVLKRLVGDDWRIYAEFKLEEWPNVA